MNPPKSETRQQFSISLMARTETDMGHAISPMRHSTDNIETPFLPKQPVALCQHCLSMNLSDSTIHRLDAMAPAKQWHPFHFIRK
jgi:hypothetical protein